MFNVGSLSIKNIRYNKIFNKESNYFQHLCALLRYLLLDAMGKTIKEFDW